MPMISEEPPQTEFPAGPPAAGAADSSFYDAACLTVDGMIYGLKNIDNLQPSCVSAMSQDPAETRAKILEEAERLFRHYGYSKTTIGDISEACSMSPANIYRFFPSKSALVEAMVREVVAALEARLFAIVRADLLASERLTRLIKEIHQHTLDDYLDHRKVHEIVLVAMEEQWLTLREHLDKVAAYFGEIIASGIERGEFAPCDIRRTAKCVHASVVTLCHPGLVALKLDEEDRESPDEMAAFLINALKAGGCPPAAKD
jgi:AcrR family transcriptional regulator